jgi:alpha-beta hydrolase superfamily lysophospholipase
MAEYSEKTGNFSGHDGLNLFYRHCPATDERARVVIAHGLGEHSGRYGNVIERLHPMNISIWAPDHRGHGNSGGRRGHVLSFEQYIADLRLLVELAAKDLPQNRKLFLLGHSMGGLIALNFALRHPELISAVIASSPGLGVAVEVSAIKSVLGKVMSSIWPGLSLSNELDATKISHDENVVHTYLDDPLVHDRVTARWFTEFLGAMQWVNQHAGQMKIPTLLQIAGDDRLVDPRSGPRFFENLTIDDKTLHVYEGLYHEIYNEPPDQRQKVLDDLEKWLEDRLS